MKGVYTDIYTSTESEVFLAEWLTLFKFIGFKFIGIKIEGIRH